MDRLFSLLEAARQPLHQQQQQQQQQPGTDAEVSDAAPSTVLEGEPPASDGHEAPGRLDALLRELFGLLDADGDGVLEQPALVRMNRRLALLHQMRQGEDTPPPAPLPDPAAQYPSFREHLLEVLATYDSSPEAQEDLVAHLITLERHDEGEQGGSWRSGVLRPGAQLLLPRRAGSDLCSQPLAAAQEYGPAALEGAKAFGSRALDATQATSHSVSIRAQRVAVRAGPKLRALAETARSTSVGAATGAASTVGTYLARARDSLGVQGCLAGSPRCRRRIGLGCPSAPEEPPQPSASEAAGGVPARSALPSAPAALQPAAPAPGSPSAGRTGLPEPDGEEEEQDAATAGRAGPELAAPWLQPPPSPSEERRREPQRRAPQAVRPLTIWRYEPQDGLHIDVRATPDVAGPRTGGSLRAGEAFQVSEERRGASGVLYLKLADGRGWVFDSKPGVGALCARAGPAPSPAPRPPRPRPPALAEEVVAPTGLAAAVPAPAPVPADWREQIGSSSGPAGEWFWQLSGPYLPQAWGSPQASNPPLLQLATHFAAQNAKDHDPSAVPWARSSSVHLTSSLRYGGA